MQLFRTALFPVLAASVLGLSGTALMAHPGDWGGPGWGSNPGWEGRTARSAPSREGKVEVARFRAEGEAAAALAQGTIAVIQMSGDAESDDPRRSATFEAAVEDQLVRAGYRAAGAAPGEQIAEVRILRSEAEPAEASHKPVSGEMTMGVSNRGSMMGLAVQFDGSKPRKALLSTRLEARIRDRTSGAVLWEGRAEMFTREGDERWDDDAIAVRLSAALFEGFPGRTGETRERR